MKIAHLLPASAVFPLKKHNGRYEWVLRLARLQVLAGHSVTIFAGKGSTDNSKISWRSVDATGLNRKYHNIQLITSALQDETFDIYHSHFDFLGFSLAHLTRKPVVTTQHWYPSEKIANNILAKPSKNAIAVPVTKLMKQEDSRLGIPATEHIYHGIDLGLFKPAVDVSRTNRLLYAGRISRAKGVLDAVKLASKHNLGMDIVGKINSVDQQYWEEVLPYVDGEKIKYLGQKTQAELVSLFTSAKAFVFLPTEVEAFGQTIIEAQACGTPVIINDLGASSELLRHGQTGYILGSGQDFENAIRAIERISSKDCIDWAKSFDIQAMVQAYSDLYSQLVNGSRL